MIAVVSMAILVTLGTRYQYPVNVSRPIAESEGERQTLPAMETDSLFFAEEFDYVSMYGNPWDWDDEKNLSLDTTGDDLNDISFSISPSKREGINLEGSIKLSDGSWESMNFWSSDLYRLFLDFLKEKSQARTIKAKDFLTMDIPVFVSLLQEGKTIVKGSSIIDDDYIQISVCDIDEDGSIEVLASVGNQMDENVTAIYELSSTGNCPFIYRGHITCDTIAAYKGNQTLWAYQGSLIDRLHDTYIYDGMKLKKILI